MTKIIESLTMCYKHRCSDILEVQRIKTAIKKDLEFFIINASDDAGNARYIEGKKEEGTNRGLNVIVKKFNSDCCDEDVLAVIKYCNENKIPVILQLPIYKHLNESALLEAIDYKVDADCFSREWLGALANNTNGNLAPATPKGVINILKYNNINICGKNTLVIGRSNHVGKPMSTMLINEGATVTTANSNTKDLSSLVKQSDIIISCVGKTDLINHEDIKKDAVVIGVGFTYIGRKQILDFSVEDIVNDGKAKIVSNRINCTGKATIDALISNVIELYKLNNNL